MKKISSLEIGDQETVWDYLTGCLLTSSTAFVNSPWNRGSRLGMQAKLTEWKAFMIENRPETLEVIATTNCYILSSVIGWRKKTNECTPLEHILRSRFTAGGRRRTEWIEIGGTRRLSTERGGAKVIRVLQDSKLASPTNPKSNWNRQPVDIGLCTCRRIDNQDAILLNNKTLIRITHEYI